MFIRLARFRASILIVLLGVAFLLLERFLAFVVGIWVVLEVTDEATLPVCMSALSKLAMVGTYLIFNVVVGIFRAI